MPARLRPFRHVPPSSWDRLVANLSGRCQVGTKISHSCTIAALARYTHSVPYPAGITAPFGYFDPLGFCEGASEGKIKFYREVELKHGRVSMLAALGFLVAEQFHPMWGGQIDVPSNIAFQETALQNFLPGVALLVGIHEVLSIFTFNSPFGGELWSIRSGEPPGLLQPLRHEPTRVCSALRISYVSPLTAPRLPRPPADYLNGDLGWDPLGLKPTDPKELKEMQVPKPAP